MVRSPSGGLLEGPVGPEAGWPQTWARVRVIWARGPASPQTTSCPWARHRTSWSLYPAQWNKLLRPVPGASQVGQMLRHRVSDAGHVVGSCGGQRADRRALQVCGSPSLGPGGRGSLADADSVGFRSRRAAGGIEGQAGLPWADGGGVQGRQVCPAGCPPPMQLCLLVASAALAPVGTDLHLGSARCSAGPAWVPLPGGVRLPEQRHPHDSFQRASE